MICDRTMTQRVHMLPIKDSGCQTPYQAKSLEPESFNGHHTDPLGDISRTYSVVYLLQDGCSGRLEFQEPPQPSNVVSVLGVILDMAVYVNWGSFLRGPCKNSTSISGSTLGPLIFGMSHILTKTP